MATSPGKIYIVHWTEPDAGGHCEMIVEERSFAGIQKIVIDLDAYVYRAPFGLPFYWKDEQSGVLPAAIIAFSLHRTGGPPPTDEQMEIVCAWMRYYIHAPCWQDPDQDGTLERLRTDAFNLRTSDDVAGWISRCLEIGLDPL